MTLPLPVKMVWRCGHGFQTQWVSYRKTMFSIPFICKHKLVHSLIQICLQVLIDKFLLSSKILYE